MLTPTRSCSPSKAMFLGTSLSYIGLIYLITFLNQFSHNTALFDFFFCPVGLIESSGCFMQT